MLRTFLMGASSSLFAAGVAWIITVPKNVIPGVAMIVAGAVAFALTYFLTKKTALPPAPASPAIHQEATISPQISPQFNIHFGDNAAKEWEREEDLILTFMRNGSHPTTPYELPEILKGTGLTEKITQSALHRMDDEVIYIAGNGVDINDCWLLRR